MVDYFQEFAEWLATLIRPHVQQIAMALVATVLFIYGGDINSAIRKRIQGCNLVIRVLIFVAICAFGYGALTVVISVLIAGWLGRLDGLYLAPVILGFLLFVGILAERKKQI